MFKRLPQTMSLLWLCGGIALASAQSQYEVWFDTDYGNRITSPMTSAYDVNVTVPLSGLPAGVHTFNFRTISSRKSYGPLMRKMFWFVPRNTHEYCYATVCEYSIDGGEAVSVDVLGDSSDLLVDISGLSAGEHTFSVRYRSLEGTWGPIFTHTFSVVGQPLDATEWQLLMALYQELQTMGWRPNWNILAGADAASSFEGVEVAAGHVVGFDFSSKGLRSTPQSMIPLSMLSFPCLQSVDLSGNALTGEVDKIFAALAQRGQSPALRTLTTLDLSDNLLSGNLGILGSDKVLPALKRLDVEHNCFSDAYPAVPATVDLDYAYQRIARVMPVDFATLRDIDFEALRGIDFTNPGPEAMAMLEQLPPTITLYRHKLQTWYPPEAYVFTTAHPDGVDAIRAIDDWTVAVAWNSYGPYLPFVSEDFYVYYGKSGDTIHAIVGATSPADGLLHNTGTDFKIRLSFADGDVNFDGLVNVTDLQSIINYIFEIYNMANVKPFNFTSANRQAADEVIDVKDAVLMVSLLLDKSAAPLTRGAEEPELAYNAGGFLQISSARPVAALELTIWGDDEIAISRALRSAGMTCEISRHDGYSRVVAYSLEGNTLAAGTLQLGSIGSNVVTEAVLSDAFAETINEPADKSDVRMLESETGAGRLTYADGVVAINCDEPLTGVKWAIYTVDGKLAVSGEAESLTAGTTLIRCGHIADGVAVAVLESDGHAASRSKIMISNR